MTRTLSKKFRFFTFVCIALLPYVHGYNLSNTYLAPFSTVDEPLTGTTFFEYLFANGLLRFRIPMLFMISGYLYAMYDNRPYWKSVQKRFTSLIIPFLIWSALGLAITFFLQQFSYTAKVVYTAGIDQLGDNRPYTEIGWGGILYRWLNAPIAFQLWFIVALFFLNLIYPFIKWALLKFPWVWVAVTFVLWFTLFGMMYVEGRGLFFFSLGVLLEKKNISPEKEPKWFSLGLAFIFFIGICIIKTFMAFELEPNTFSTSVTLLVLYQLASIAGLLVVWFGSDRVVKWCMEKKWFHTASGFAFFIFGLHVPLLPYFMHFAMMQLDFIPQYRLICYLLIPALMMLFCIGAGVLIKKYLPQAYVVMTGGRGF